MVVVLERGDFVVVGRHEDCVVLNANSPYGAACHAVAKRINACEHGGDVVDDDLAMVVGNNKCLSPTNKPDLDSVDFELVFVGVNKYAAI